MLSNSSKASSRLILTELECLKSRLLSIFLFRGQRLMILTPRYQKHQNLIPLYHFLYHRILFLMIQNYLNHHCRYYHVCAYCVILI